MRRVRISVYPRRRLADSLPGGEPRAPGGRRHAAVLAATAFLVLAASPQARADGGIYKRVDERGVVHFTNVGADSRWTMVRAPRGFARSVRPRPSHTFDGLIARVAASEGIPAALVKAVIHAESSFDPRAVSPKGAMGLMQLMPGTARDLGVGDPFLVEENVRGGTRYLRTLRERYASWTHTLAAYNAGPTAVDRYRGIPPYAETREYVRRVLSYYRRYHGDFAR